MNWILLHIWIHWILRHVNYGVQKNSWTKMCKWICLACLKLIRTTFQTRVLARRIFRDQKPFIFTARDNHVLSSPVSYLYYFKWIMSSSPILIFHFQQCSSQCSTMKNLTKFYLCREYVVESLKKYVNSNCSRKINS